MSVSIVFCASETERLQAMALLKADGKTPSSFKSDDGMATTWTVANNKLVAQSVAPVAFVVVGAPSSGS